MKNNIKNIILVKNSIKNIIFSNIWDRDILSDGMNSNIILMNFRLKPFKMIFVFDTQQT